MAVLKIKDASGERVVHISGKRLTMGRLSDNDIVLADETVSRHHAEIAITPRGYILKDLGTRNGTWVNGKVIDEAALRDGDEVRVGTTTLVFSARETFVSYEAGEEVLASPSTIIRPSTSLPFNVSDHKKLEIIYNISQAVNSIFDKKELAQKVAEEVLKIIRADRFLLMLKDEKSSELVPEIAIGRDMKEAGLSVSRTMVERVVREGVSILVRNILEDARFKTAQSLILREIASILCAPLRSKEGIIGLIYVDSKESRRSFSEDELEIFTAVGNQIAVAFQNIRMQERLWQKKRVERELEIAARIQKSFLPGMFPACPGYSFGVSSIPAHNVGGDFYDWFRLSRNRIGFVIGDVAGRGIPAALYMARFLNEFKLAAVNFSNPAMLMDEMNRRFKEIVVGGNFVSAAYLILEQERGVLNYALAGCHPILFCQNSSFKELGMDSGQILGIGEGAFKDETICMGDGDIAVLYTDGVIEAKDKEKEIFGLERLKEEVFKFRGLGADEIAGHIADSVIKFSAGEELSDDLTILILKKG